ncbi:hypothetical protein AOQ84DRAFT_364339 [Glonium stellatum]|uniref:Uncharacterized protein n=1 Tax=Glonium stellatum TaxID=574774 RepID=A0A8E2F084_9PEZI|nr:hypothetical protein AOQ84DRAFT_364339 [Glonium stellatum]
MPYEDVRVRQNLSMGIANPSNYLAQSHMMRIQLLMCPMGNTIVSEPTCRAILSCRDEDTKSLCYIFLLRGGSRRYQCFSPRAVDSEPGLRRGLECKDPNAEWSLTDVYVPGAQSTLRTRQYNKLKPNPRETPVEWQKIILDDHVLLQAGLVMKTSMKSVGTPLAGIFTFRPKVRMDADYICEPWGTFVFEEKETPPLFVLLLRSVPQPKLLGTIIENQENDHFTQDLGFRPRFTGQCSWQDLFESPILEKLVDGRYVFVHARRRSNNSSTAHVIIGLRGTISF